MTTGEFKNEFEILYDSIASMSAPALDDYEISVFLTQAQLQLIKEYNGNVNKYKASFEGSDKRRADMRELIVDYTITPTAITNGMSEDSYQVVLPNDLFLIKYEAAFYTDPSCGDKNKIDIIPIKYDEYHDKKRNPFRRPDNFNGFRLDIQSFEGDKIAEIICSHTIESYQIRYVKYPTPIIIADLSGISNGLSIDGRTNTTECELDQEFHREILDRAVELAMLAYKQEALVSKVQLDQRNN